MKKSNLLKAIPTLALGSALLIGCAHRDRAYYSEPGYDREVIVSTAPPPPVVERRVVVAPRPGYVWIDGGYTYSRNRWNWERGHYVRPPRPGAVWVPPRYDHRDGTHVYIRGYWR